MRVFLIGPGGVGKTTVGPLLARHTGKVFVDLDELFLSRSGSIRGYLDRYGYSSYLQRNAELLEELLLEGNVEQVVALSSGFLATESAGELAVRNRERIARAGVSILLMPSLSREVSQALVVERQLHRGLGLAREEEEKKFRVRYAGYRKLGQIQIFSRKSPEVIARMAAARLGVKRLMESVPLYPFNQPS